MKQMWPKRVKHELLVHGPLNVTEILRALKDRGYKRLITERQVIGIVHYDKEIMKIISDRKSVWGLSSHVESGDWEKVGQLKSPVFDS